MTGAGGGAVVDGTAVGVPISTLLALGSVVGVDGGTQDRDSTEHLLYQAVATSPRQVTLACTHLVAVPTPHWAVSMVVAGSPPAELELSRDLAGSAVTVVRLGGRTARAAAGPWQAGADAAADQLLSGAGRAVVFAGQDRLPATVTVEDVLRLTAIGRVLGVAGTPTAGRVLHTRGYVRPHLLQGELVLHVRPYGADSQLAPFEVPEPTPCCAAHG